VVNVNGLRRRCKRRTLFQRLRELHYAVVVLCETHSKNDAETTSWAQEGAGPGMPWEGQTFWHHGTSAVGVFLTAKLLKEVGPARFF
jgi:exonuclease III